jgi:hypothetical protein
MIQLPFKAKFWKLVYINFIYIYCYYQLELGQFGILIKKIVDACSAHASLGGAHNLPAACMTSSDGQNLPSVVSL